MTENTESYDIVSSFGVLPHYSLGGGGISADRLLRLLDRATARVLFIDHGQRHLDGSDARLVEWDPNRTVDWISRVSSFDRVEFLGEDNEVLTSPSHSFGRFLFACVRGTG